MVCARNQSALDESLKRLHYVQEQARVNRDLLRMSGLVFRLPILEHYREGKLSILLHMRAGGHGDVPRRLLMSSECEPILGYSCLILRFNASNARIEENWDKKPMFVSDVESVHGPDGHIPSRVGLYIGKHHPKKLVRGPIYSIPAKRSLKVVISGVDREFSELPEGVGGEFGNRLNPRIIEGALEIMEGIPRNQRDISAGISARNVMFDDFVSKFRIDLDRRSATLMEELDPTSQSSDMMIGPLDF